MAKITLQGNALSTVGELPAISSSVNFNLVASDLSEKTVKDFAGKKVVLNIFPSIDTGTCAASARQFNQEASALENTVVINVSKDLPFALNRFCASEGLENVINLSDFRGALGQDFGVEIADGALKGLLSRAVVVLDEKGQVSYTQQVSEIADEPNYSAAIAALKA